MAAALKLTGSPTSGFGGREGEGGVRAGRSRSRSAWWWRRRRQRRSRAGPTVRAPALENEWLDLTSLGVGAAVAVEVPVEAVVRDRLVVGGGAGVEAWPSGRCWGGTGEKTKDGYRRGVQRGSRSRCGSCWSRGRPESVTCSRTVLMPAVANAWSASLAGRVDGAVVVEVPARTRRSPATRSSPDPDASKPTVSPTSGAVGEKSKDAVGGALTVTVWETVSATPSDVGDAQRHRPRAATGTSAVGVMPERVVELAVAVEVPGVGGGEERAVVARCPRRRRSPTGSGSGARG